MDDIIKDFLLESNQNLDRLSRLEKAAHAGENPLSKLREAQLTLNSEITTGLVAMVDAVRRMLAEIQATERDGDND